jgi:hypothetical protein
MKHHWVPVGVGNWWSEYQCTLCKTPAVVEPEDGGEPPAYGCSGSGEINKMSWRCMWGVTIRQSDGMFHVVNEDGVVQAKFDEVKDGYNHISITDEAWENEDGDEDESA